jgi:hypothetical protein
MKTIHYMFTAMLALSACASFTACSSDDVNTGQQKVETADGFYMTLTLKGSDAKGANAKATRTAVQDPTEAATADESTVNSGTLYLFSGVVGSGTLAYKKTITTAEWNDAKVPTQGRNGSITVKLPIKNVTVGTSYRVYFLANGKGVEDDSGNSTIEAGDVKFVNGYAKPGEFIMFSQNNPGHLANQYTVTFTEENKNKDKPVTLSTPILIERAVARIDVPTNEATSLTVPSVEDLAKMNPQQKEALQNARDNVKSITLEKYAISNLAKKTYIMQHWSDNNRYLTLPTNSLGYWQTYDEFGTETRNDGSAFFKTLTNATPDYVFENTTSENKNSTAMYFQYKVELKSYENADFTDGTFYRYDGKIYTRLADIIESGKYGTNPFGKTADELLTKDLLRTNGKLGANETALEAFRNDHNIQIFPQGMVYYRQLINDVHYVREGWNSILRNTIYKLNVKSVWNIGADVPNGDNGKETKFYYLNVEVSVNPWVLNTQNVILK